MFREALKDGWVWLAGGMFLMTIYSALQEFGGESSVSDFFQGLCIGLAAVAFGAAIFFLVRRQRSQPSRPAPAKKSRK